MSYEELRLHPNELGIGKSAAVVYNPSTGAIDAMKVLPSILSIKQRNQLLKTVQTLYPEHKVVVVKITRMLK